MKRAGLIFTAMGVLTLLGAAPAAAQTQAAGGAAASGNDTFGIPGFQLGGKEVDPQTAEKRREIEEAYKRTTKNQPTQATASANDPWANMRGADEAKPAAKPAVKMAPKKKPAQ